MNEASVEDLQRAVEQMHNCRASLRETVQVREQFRKKVVWEGIVHVFDLEGHPAALTCYAWSAPIEGSKKRKFYAVLHVLPVTSPVEAVRAAIIQDHRSE